jgi:hypothetical protein
VVGVMASARLKPVWWKGGNNQKEPTAGDIITTIDGTPVCGDLLIFSSRNREIGDSLLLRR